MYLCICTSVLARKRCKRTGVLVLAPSWWREQEDEGRTRGVARDLSCRRFHTDVHVQSIKMLIILLSTVLASLLKGWKMFFPPHSATKGHVITDYLAGSLSKAVSVCVTGKNRQIPHQLCKSNPAHDLPMTNTSVNWVVGKIISTVLETIQNNKESPSK